MSIKEIQISGHTFVTIECCEGGLKVLTHKDTEVNIVNNILVIKDPNNGNNFNNSFNNISINGNSSISFNGYSFVNNFNNINKNQCNIVHEIKCQYDIDKIGSKGAMSTSFLIPLNQNCQIILEGSGKLNFKVKYKFQNINVILTGSGDIIIDCDAINANIVLSGSGDISINGLIQNAQMTLTGSGDINEFTIEKTGSFILTGRGDIKGRKLSDAIITKNKTGSGDIKIK